MEIYIFLLSILFWLLYYFFEGSHDGTIANEVKLLKSHLSKEDNEKINDDFIKHELNWHLFDGLEKAFVKIVFSIFVYLITDNLLFSFQMLLLSVGIRSFAHDFFVAIRMGKGLNHIGPDFLWWDRFLRRMQTIGINQYIIKFIPNIVIIIWIILTL